MRSPPPGLIAQKAAPPVWHLDRLDALRGLAILGVVVVHAAGACNFPFYTANLLLNGQRGVQLFFIVSALTLFLSQENRRGDEARPTLNYFIRRFFRLAPMYYLAIVLTLWLMPSIAGSLTDLVLGLFFLQGLSPHAIVHVAVGTWTIADEAFFYATLPLLVRYIKTLRSAIFAVCLAAPCLLLGSMLLTHRRPQLGEFFAFFWFPIEFPVFLLGIVVYFFWKTHVAPRTSSARLPHLKLSSLALLASAAALALCNVPHDNRKLYPTSIGCALLVLALLLHAWPLFVNRVTIYLGKISFSVYLLHYFVMKPIIQRLQSHPALVARPWLSFTLLFVATLSLTSILAGLTWLYVEQTGIRLGRRLIAHLEHRAARNPNTTLPVPAAALRNQNTSPDAQF